MSRLQRLPDEVDTKQGTLLYSETCEGKAITLVVGKGEGDWPAVLSVFGDQDRFQRLVARRGRKWQSKDSRRLEILKRYGFMIAECAQIMGKQPDDLEIRW